ncbi:MAG TPA: hypothetical protein V6C64_10135, partial [Microcoleaceae cyanobacterium]
MTDIPTLSDLQGQDFTNLAVSPAAVSSVLTYNAPKELLLNTLTVLKGNYDTQKIAKVTLVAEDKYPLTVALDPGTKTWYV